MIKKITKPLVPVIKWSSVIAATVITVISIQANADGHGNHSVSTANTQRGHVSSI